MKTTPKHPFYQEENHGLSDTRRLVVAVEKIARSLGILVDRRLGDAARRLNRSSAALEATVRATTPKK